MNVDVESRIVGTFLGNATGAVHRLDDGSEWEHVGHVKEYLYRDRQAGRIRREPDRLYLDVEGTCGIADGGGLRGGRPPLRADPGPLSGFRGREDRRPPSQSRAGPRMLGPAWRGPR
jgi:hypothetical protein